MEEDAPPPEVEATDSGIDADAQDPEALPTAGIAGLEGPEPPEASGRMREQRRFFRYDRNRDWGLTRTEMMSSRTNSFRNLVTDGNNLLTFEEWAITTNSRFHEMDADEDNELTPAEFATSAPKRKPKKEKPKFAC